MKILAVVGLLMHFIVIINAHTPPLVIFILLFEKKSIDFKFSTFSGKFILFKKCYNVGRGIRAPFRVEQVRMAQVQDFGVFLACKPYRVYWRPSFDLVCSQVASHLDLKWFCSA
jgi:hypothetical protein